MLTVTGGGNGTVVWNCSPQRFCSAVDNMSLGQREEVTARTLQLEGDLNQMVASMFQMYYSIPASGSQQAPSR